MSTTYPTSLQDLDATRGSSGNPLSSPNHITHHTNEDDTIEALQAKVGVDGSAVTTSHDYKLSEVTSTDKAVGKTATQTLTNKTLTAPIISTISNSGTLTLPTSTDTLVGKATTDVLSNKTIADDVNTLKIGTKTVVGGSPASGQVLGYNGTNWVPTTVAIPKFGGTGADGALSITSGTTTIDLGGAAVVTKNYTSISITGTGQLAFSNPHANGTTIILKSQGAVTITSSGSPGIDASGMGAAGGAGGGASGGAGAKGAGGGGGAGSSANGTAGGNGGSGGISSTAGSAGNGIISTTGGGGAVTNTGGTAGALALALGTGAFPYFKFIPLVVGAGGGGGGGGEANDNSAKIGGFGGAALYIECGGAWNFTGTISVAGKAGVAGVTNGGGSGGGGGGTFAALYGSLTANSGTVTSTGGTGGSGTDGGGTGGNGGAGLSLIAINTEYS